MQFLALSTIFMSLLAFGNPAANLSPSTRWCKIEAITNDVFTVTRFSFEENGQVNLSYLRVNERGVPTSYDVKTDANWVPMGQHWRSPNSYGVEVLDGSSPKVSLEDVLQQGFLLEKFLQSHPTVEKPVSLRFNPPKAVRLAGGNAVTTLYPCGAYVPSFAASKTVGPTLEYYLFISQSRWLDKIAHYRDRLDSAMALQFPLVQVDTAETAVEGSRWCSWNKEYHNLLNVKMMTFGGGRVAVNSAVNFAFEYPTLLKQIIEETAVIALDENGKYLRGSGELFAAMEDSSGTRVLVQLDSYRPDSMRSFDNIFFKCDDPRPLRGEDHLRANLPWFLDQLSSKLNF